MFTYIPKIIDDSDLVFQTLMNELVWEQRPDAPRMEYWTNIFNRPYTYGRGRGQRTYESRPSHKLIDDINERVADGISELLFEGCFLNAYKGARDHLGWHADDDPGINHARPIAVVTVGAGRMLQIKEQKIDATPSNFFLEPGSLFLMHAGMQFTHFHKIPKSDRPVDPRISLTYRSLLPL